MNQAQQLAHYIESLPDFEILKETAELLDIDERTLDYSIWTYMAG